MPATHLQEKHKQALAKFFVHAFLVVLLTIILTLTFMVGLPVGAQTSNRCIGFASEVYSSEKVAYPKEAECEPNRGIAKIDINGGELILDMGRGNEIIDGLGYDFYFYEMPHMPGIWLDFVEVSVAQEGSPDNPGNFKTVFVWGDTNSVNNGSLFEAYLPEIPERKINAADLHNGTGIGIDILSDDQKMYRFVRFRSYILAPNTVADPKPEIDAIERIHRETPQPTIEPATPAPTSASGTSEPPTMTSEPPTMTSEPPTMTSEPPTMTSEPPTMTSELPTMTSEPPTMTSEPPTMTSELPTVTSELPTVTSKPPTVTSKPPTMTSEPPTVTSKPPTVTSKPPTVTSEPPTVTSEPPTVTSEPPTVTVAKTIVQISPTLRVFVITPHTSTPFLPITIVPTTHVEETQGAITNTRIVTGSVLPIPTFNAGLNNTPTSTHILSASLTPSLVLTPLLPTKTDAVPPPQNPDVPPSSKSQSLNCDSLSIIGFITCLCNYQFTKWDKASNVAAEIVGLVIWGLMIIINLSYSTKSTSFLNEKLSEYPYYRYYSKNKMTIFIVMIRFVIFLMIGILNAFVFLLIVYFFLLIELSEQVTSLTLFFSTSITFGLHSWILREAIGLRWLSSASREELKMLLDKLSEPIETGKIDQVLEDIDRMRQKKQVVRAYQDLEVAIPNIFQRTELQYHVRKHMFSLLKEQISSIFSQYSTKEDQNKAGTETQLFAEDSEVVSTELPPHDGSEQQLESTGSQELAKNFSEGDIRHTKDKQG